MPVKMGVQIMVDLEKYTEIVGDRLAQRIAVGARNEAKRIVRKDTWNLSNSVRTDKIADGEYETSSNTPYSAAQEFGRPDIPKYGFTPYMRPAAVFATDTERVQQYLKEAEEAALLGASIK